MLCVGCIIALFWFFFFQAEDGIRDLVRSRGLGDVYKRQGMRCCGCHVALARFRAKASSPSPGSTSGGGAGSGMSPVAMSAAVGNR